MKYLLLAVVLAVFATVNSNPLERHARSAEEDSADCLLDYSLLQLRELRNSIKLGIEVPGSKQFVFCLTKAINVFDEKSGFDVDRIVEVLRIDGIAVARDIVEKCSDKNEQKSTPIEWLQRGMGCMLQRGLLINKEFVQYEVLKVISSKLKKLDESEEE